MRQTNFASTSLSGHATEEVEAARSVKRRALSLSLTNVCAIDLSPLSNSSEIDVLDSKEHSLRHGVPTRCHSVGDYSVPGECAEVHAFCNHSADISARALNVTMISH